MSIFDEALITKESLYAAGFHENIYTHNFSKYGFIKKITTSMQYSINIDKITESNWLLEIYIHDMYVQFRKDAVINNIFDVYKMMSYISDITYEELYANFQCVTVC